MTKALQILFGIVLILVLAYIAFLDVSSTIKDDLLLKTKTVFENKGIVDITAKVEGEGMGLSRILSLNGTVVSETEKIRITTLLEDLEGVACVSNHIVVKERKDITSPTVEPSTPKSMIKSVDEMPIIHSVPMKPMESKKSQEIVAEKILEKKTIVNSSIDNIKIPSIPKVKELVIIVPLPVSVTEVPVAIKVEKNKNIKIEGVE